MSEKVPKQVIDELRRAVDPTPVGIVMELTRAGYEAYIVGGAVRDLLLGKQPKDYDISTSATPEEVRKVFGRRRCHVIGRRFRLAHVYANGEIYEVSTFRRTPNERERQGRKHEDGPIIWNDNCFGTLEDDAKRRDFTVNGLYLDVAGKRGVIDFSDGYKDLRDGIVRCIGEPSRRMAEDPVRMLRALKLVGQCGFALEPSLEAVIRGKAHEIKLSSAARLFEELLKLLANPACDQTLRVMHEYGFLREFWPTVDEAWDDQEGELMRHLLKLRGDAIRRGHYSNSRGLALSTVALPFMMTALNPEKPTDFWEGNAAGDPIAHRALELIFEGIAVPRLLSERILQIIGLVPRLVKKPVLGRYLNHAEYRYGRALVALLVQVFGWDAAILADLPEFSPRYDDSMEEAFEDGAEPLVSQRRGAPKKAIPGLVPLTREVGDTQAVEVAASAGQTPSDDVFQEKPSAPSKSKRRKRSRKRNAASMEFAPEASPALNEVDSVPGRDETPVVTAPPAEPSKDFFKPESPKGAVSFNGVESLKPQKKTPVEEKKPSVDVAPAVSTVSFNGLEPLKPKKKAPAAAKKPSAEAAPAVAAVSFNGLEPLKPKKKAPAVSKKPSAEAAPAVAAVSFNGVEPLKPKKKAQAATKKPSAEVAPVVASVSFNSVESKKETPVAQEQPASTVTPSVKFNGVDESSSAPVKNAHASRGSKIASKASSSGKSVKTSPRSLHGKNSGDVDSITFGK